MGKIKKFFTEVPSFKSKKSALRSGLIRFGRNKYLVKKVNGQRWKPYKK